MDERANYLATKCKQSLEKGDYDSLLANAQQLEKLVDNKYLARFWQGTAYYYKKDFKKSAEFFYSLYLGNFKSKKEDDSLLFYLAMNYLYLKRLNDSLIIFQKLEKKDQKNIDVKIMLYLNLYLLGDVDLAIAELSDALEIDRNKTVATLEKLITVALQKSSLKEETKHLIKELIKRL